MTKQKLTKEAIEAIRADKALRIDIMSYFECNESTLYRLLRENHEKLTQVGVLAIIQYKHPNIVCHENR